MMIVRTLQIFGISAALLLTARVCSGQRVTETSVPLGKALDYALEQSALTGPNAKPFHIRVHLFESTNPPSPYRADIEEYWVSPKQWRRSIASPEFKQTLIASGDQIGEQNTGDYYPLWLKSFITALFDPVPNADQWNKLDAKITQITLPTGQRSDACARMKFKIGSDTVNNDAFAHVCFDGAGLLKFVGSPGYSMEFNDYQRFGKKMIARRYQDDPEQGTELVANVVLLEELKNPDVTLFSIGQTITPPEQRLQSVFVSQATIERAAEGQPALAWPPVQSGKTTGLLSMYVSVDRQGHVREAYPLNSDNAGLEDAARDQLLKWKLKPMTANGVPVQAEAPLTFRFETMLAANAAQPTGQASSGSHASNAVPPLTVRVSPGVLEGFLVDRPAPVYPPEAKGRHIQGKVVLALTIDKAGATRDIRVLTSPDQALTDSAVAAVSHWHYRPYLLNGSPVEVQSAVEVTFELP